MTNRAKLTALVISTRDAITTRDRQTIRDARWPARKLGYAWLERLIQNALCGDHDLALTALDNKLAELAA